MKISFSNLTSTIDNPEELWQILLRIVADFEIYINNRQFYFENDFPVIEFASQTLKWLQQGSGSFLFESMESHESPLIAFYFKGDNDFGIYSPHQLFTFTEVINETKLHIALTSFINELYESVRKKLNLDISEFL